MPIYILIGKINCFVLCYYNYREYIDPDPQKLRQFFFLKIYFSDEQE